MSWVLVLAATATIAGADTSTIADEAIADEAAPGAEPRLEETPATVIVDDPIDVDEEVVITGGRIETKLSRSPIAVELIDRQQIEESGAENLTDILEDAPGVQVTHSRGKAGIELEGLDSKYVLILIDGQRAIGRVDGVIDLSRFTAERIERVEIVKGAASALYGADALAGVVNIITRRTKKPFEAEAHLSGGSFKLFDGTVAVGSSGDNYNLRLTLGFHRGDSYQTATAERLAGDPSTSGPGYNEAGGEIRGEYDMTPDDSLVLRADYLFRDANSIAATPIPQKDMSIIFQTFHQTNRTENYSVGLSWAHQLESAAGKVTSTAYFSGWREQFLQDVRGVKGDIPIDARERLVQGIVQYDELMGDHMVTIGTELLYEDLFATDRICRPLAPGGCTPNALGQITGENASDASRVRWAAFLQDEWTIHELPRLVLVPGFRADVDTYFGTHPTPKLSGRFDPIEEVALRASYGLGFRAPGFRELYLSFSNPSAGYNVRGNPELSPETSRSFNVGTEVKPIDPVKISVSYFRNDLTNLIDYSLIEMGSIGTLDVYQYTNIAEARTQGIEASVNYRPLSFLSLSAGYSFLDSLDKINLVPLVGRAKHTVEGKIRFEETWSDSVLFAHAEWLGERLYPDLASGITEVGPAYVMLDARAEKRFGEYLDVFIGADNILDVKDSRFLLVRPRVIYAGITGRM